MIVVKINDLHVGISLIYDDRDDMVNLIKDLQEMHDKLNKKM